MCASSSSSTGNNDSHHVGVQVDQCYWIACFHTKSDDKAFIPMKGDKLEKLFLKMPTLRHLLLGHPGMEPKAQDVREDGTILLELSETFGIDHASFLYLLHCVFGLQPLPHPLQHPLERENLLTTLTTLGGCEELEERLAKQRMTNPLKPEDDFNGDYTWRVFPYSLSVADLRPLEQEGYFYSTSEPSSEDNKRLYYFRKEKKG